MSPLDMCFFGAVIFAVIKIVEFAIIWNKKEEN